MSQQYAQFEEEFRDGPQPHASYEEGYSEPPSFSYPARQSSRDMPDQKRQAPAQNTGQAASGIGARVFLAIVSMLFVCGMFLIALVMSSLHNPVNNVSSVLAILFAFVFAILAVLINLIINRRH
jgi:magnesium-transporting ATPase (P-type)